MTHAWSFKRVSAVLIICLLAGVMFQPGNVNAQAAYGTIKGQVVEEATGNPLVGANVFLVGTRLGNVTDAEGNYEIVRVEPGNYTVQVSFIGYKTFEQTVSVGPGQTVTGDFELAVDVLGLGEVVVTGMGGTQIKEKLGVSIAKVAPTQVQNSDESSVVAALSGKVANVEITKQSGEPGAGTYIRIRGSNTLTGTTQPLFVIDGVPVNNSTNFNSLGYMVQSNRAADINNEDIESIEILKGSAASAIYGSRAANGVVLITTKSGRPGKTRIDYKFSYSWDEVNKMPDIQTMYGQGRDGAYIAGYSGSWGPRLDASTPIYDHAYEIFETGHNTEHNITMSGGNEFTTFFLSAGRLSQDGVFKGKGDYERTTFRVKGEQVVTEKFKITGNLAYVNTEVNYIQSGSNISGLLLGALRTPPDFNNLPYKHPENGYQRSYRNSSTSAPLRQSRGYDNPFWIMNEHVNAGDTGRVYGNVKLEYDFTDWFSMNYTLGSDYISDDLKAVEPPGGSSYPNGQLFRDQRTRHEIDNNLIATVELGHFLNRFNENISGTFMGGYNANRREYYGLFGEGYYMPFPEFHQLDGAVNWETSESENLIHTESYFGQMTLDLYDQLFLTAAIRNDGSSTFAQDDQRHWFPKFSAAWEFTKVATDLPLLNYGKLRFAYGESGSQPTVYSMFSGLASGSFTEGWGPSINSTYNGYSGFYTSGTKGQTAIKPERTKEYEFGADLAFYDSRIGFDITYYNARATDVIFSSNLPGSIGYTSQVQNAAELENKGWELTFNANPVRQPNFSWDMTVIWAMNENQVISLAGQNRYNLGGFAEPAAYAIPGHAFGTFYGIDFIKFGRGVVYQGVDIDATYSGWSPGDLFIDADGFPEEDATLRELGDPNPDWTGSFRSDFTVFKKWRLSVLFDIKQGGDIWNGTKGALYYFGKHSDQNWRETPYVFEGYGPGAGKEVLRGRNWHAQGDGSGFTGPSSQFIEDGSYVKLRELAAAYTIDHDYIRKLGLASIDVRLSARNLKTWTDYSGVDPETNLMGTHRVRGFDYFQNPQTRSYVMTLRFHY